jgi:hypothetical protein
MKGGRKSRTGEVEDGQRERVAGRLRRGGIVANETLFSPLAGREKLAIREFD